MEECSRCCQEKPDVALQVCPYNSDIYGDETLHLLCDQCVSEAADDI